MTPFTAGGLRCQITARRRLWRDPLLRKLTFCRDVPLPFMCLATQEAVRAPGIDWPEPSWDTARIVARWIAAKDGYVALEVLCYWLGVTRKLGDLEMRWLVEYEGWQSLSEYTDGLAGRIIEAARPPDSGQ